MGEKYEGEVMESALSDPALLDKIDELRQLGVASMVPLPQVVVIGQQSAGKSSVLESVTGFPFPRGTGLCTRYPTEISCRRDAVRKIVVTIRPQAGASAERSSKLKAFNVDVSDLDPRSSAFQDIFEKAAIAMDIRTGDDPEDTRPAFSEDVLRIEITGPKEDNLTIIDVPGIIETPSPPITTKADVPLVKSMVRRYMKESRTIIVLVAHCTSDIDTQQIFEDAEAVDPEGKRTICVLTKPDILKEQATKAKVLELVRGERKPLKLGYFVVRNRGADDTASTLDQRNAAESAFFGESPWNELDRTRLGIPALCNELRTLLMDRARHEFPNVIRDVTARLKINRKQLQSLGDSRGTPDQQRVYLGRVAGRFYNLCSSGLDGYYTRDRIFDQRPESRLVTRIQEASDMFAKTLFAKGHTRELHDQTERRLQKPSQPVDSAEDIETKDDTLEDISRNDLYDVSFEIPTDAEFPELAGLVTEPFRCPNPVGQDIIEYIRELYHATRGQEVGTFKHFMLAAVFKEQSRKWRDLTLAHVSNAILIVHHFIVVALGESCADDAVCTRLRTFIMDDLIYTYRRAMDHANFLLQIECEGNAITSNPDCATNLQKNQEYQLACRSDEMKEDEISVQGHKGMFVPKQKAVNMISATQEPVEQICEDVHELLRTYYELARSRFVESIYLQVVDHFLLSDEASALRVFGPERVIAMNSQQLESIADEDASTKRTRERLGREISSLEKALVVLRT